jgi:hypothetical protein
MRRLLLVLFILVAPLVLAQDKTLTTPVTFSNATKVKIDQFAFDRAASAVSIRLVYQTSGDVDVPAANLPSSTLTKFIIPSPAGSPCTSATTLNGLAGAMNVVRSGETGTNARIQQFRIVGYLSDQGCLPAGTLNP